MESNLTIYVKTGNVEVTNQNPNTLQLNGDPAHFVKGFISEHNTSESAHTYIQGRITLNSEIISAHMADSNNPHVVTKAQVGLGNVDNTSDLDKPISTATQTALNGKQDTISDLSTIRSGAELGATAVQPGDLATVATSGSYTDLINQPTIPTVNDATLTIQKNGTNVATFTANSSSNATANITVPTQASDIGAQETLVSGTNIKTVNNNSLLGSGNLDIDALPSQTGQSGKFLTTDGSSASWAAVSSADGANKSLSNLTNVGNNISNWSSNTTDCLVEVPQNVKLTLSTGTLTLQTGSKVYVPNGWIDSTYRKFDEVTIASDLTRTDTTSATKAFLFYVLEENRIVSYANVFAGDTAPTFTGQGIWYDTANNIIKRSVDSGATWDNVKLALPLGRVTNDGTGFSSIDETFNGMGYMVNIVFVLTGVKGLIANGRNEDGTLKSSYFERTRPAIATISAQALTNRPFATSSGYNTIVYNEQYYNEYENIVHGDSPTGSQYFATTFAYVTTNASGNVIAFSARSPYHAADVNLSNVTSITKVANALGMDTTAGVSLPSGTTLTAPGWIVCTFTDISNGIAEFRLDGVTVFQWSYQYQPNTRKGTFYAVTGQLFTIQTSGSCTATATYYPLKGVI